jgi:hypothetical protein
MSAVTEPPVTATATSGDLGTRRLQRGVLAIVMAVVLVGSAAILLVNRHASTTPAQFADFTKKLNTVTAPAGSFTAVDPAFEESGTTYAPADSWAMVGPMVFASTDDPHWWVASRSWEKTVTPGQRAAACRDVVNWLATSGRELGLPGGMNETLSRCMKVSASAQSRFAGIDYSWAGRGLQVNDGKARYRTGVESMSVPGSDAVTMRVTAQATVSNP